MMTDEAGNPFDILVSPLGLTSRINPAQIVEAALGKISEKTGKVYRVKDFDEQTNYAQYATDELKKYGLAATETVIDPRNGRKIPNIATGNRWMMKLHHMADDKLQGRGLGAYSCFDKKTDVLTKDGWKAWEAVDHNSQFATLVDGQLTYQFATRITREHYVGDLYGFKGRYVDYLVTPNHRMWARRQSRGEKSGRKYPQYAFMSAEDVPRLKKGVVMQQGGFTPPYDLLTSVFVVPGTQSAGKRSYQSQPSIGLEVHDYAELCGWFISEGSATHTKKCYMYAVAIAQVEHASPAEWARIGQLLDRCGLKYTYAKDKKRESRGRRGYRVASKPLWTHFKQFGHGCQNKRIPRHLFALPLSARKQLFEALMLGDGSHTVSRDGSVAISYTTTSQGLADDVQELALSIGLGGSVRKVKEAGWAPNCVAVWQVGIFVSRTEAHVGVQARSSAKFYSQPYSGMVYCATVPAGLLITRRNGKVLVTGNSDGTPGSKTDTSDGAKRLGLLDLHAILSSGATQVLREAHMLRGQANPKYWTDFMSGNTPAEPLVPETYKAFVSKLQASGINPVRSGTKTQLMAMTDKDVDALTGDRELQNADTVDWKTMDGLPGGLFDSALSGGHSSSSGGGSRWSHIKLHTPLPNPVFEDPIRQVLGLTKPKFEAVLSGKDPLTFAGMSHGTGPQAVQQALASINLPKLLEQTREQVKSTKKTQRDSAIRKLGYLKTADELGIHPKDWILSKVPVLPPAFRPISVMGNKKLPLVDDANLLYKDLFEANKNVSELSKHLSPADYGDETLTTYKAFKAVTGLGDPVQVKNVERGVEGILKHVLGTGGPKTSMVQRKLLGGTVDFVSRGVIIANPDLDMDQVGIPEDKAWAMYQPMVVRRLVRQGMGRAEAIKASESKTAPAKKALDEELKEAVVIYNRAPVLHRYGFMAGKPILTKEKVLQLPTFVFKGLGADIDGNCLDYDTHTTVLVSDTLLRYTAPGVVNPWRTLGVVMFGIDHVNAVVGDTAMRIKIGEFPRLGDFSVTSKGQELYAVPAGVRIASYDPETRETKLCDITGFTVDRNHACAEVVTKRNRKVVVSTNESLCVYDPETDRILKMRPEDSVGKLMPYLKRDIISGTKNCEELAWLCGALVADGWVTGGRTIGYSKNNQAKLDRVEALVQKLLDPAVKALQYDEEKREGKFASSKKIHLNSAKAATSLPDIYHPDKDKPENNGVRAAIFKQLPQDLLHNGSRSTLLWLLSGLLDGDSSLGWNKRASSAKKYAKPLFHCAFNTSSPYLAEDIQLLLRKLGVRATLIIKPAYKQSRESYQLVTSLPDLAAIAVDLHCLGEEERDMIEQFLVLAEEQPFKDDLDIVPIAKSTAELFSTIFCGKINTLYSAARQSLKSGRVGRGTARRFLNECPQGVDLPGLAAFEAVVDNEDVHWDAVATVTPVTNRDVFDFEIPETKTYALSNGLVVWDTMNVQALVTDNAKQDALAKMLPSKNLNSTGSFKVHQLPEKDYVAGLHAASTASEDDLPTLTFAKVVDAVRAHAAGKIGLGRKIKVLEEDE